MKAARLHELGGVPQIDEVAPPEGPGVIRVAAVSLNPIDISIANGRFYGGSPPLPYVIGSEAVATTEDGRRVWVRGRQLLAEAIDPADPGVAWVFDVPEGVDDATALGCGISGLTAWLAVTWRTEVRTDDTVLVLGASGTLGSVAVQAAKALGARRVIGAARRTDLVPAAADEVVDLTADGELPAASLIVDALWGEPLERAFAAAPVGVRIVHLGQSAGPAATILSAWVRGKDGNDSRPLALRHPCRRGRDWLSRALRAGTRGPDHVRHRDLPARPGRRGMGTPGLGQPGREDRRRGELTGSRRGPARPSEPGASPVASGAPRRRHRPPRRARRDHRT